MSSYLSLISVSFGTAVGLFLIVALLRKNRKTSADWILFSWFLIVLTHLSYFHLSFNQYLDGYPIFQAIGNSLPILHILIIFLYVKALLGELNLFLFIKNLFIFLIYLLTFYFMIHSGKMIWQGHLLKIDISSPWYVYWVTPSFLIVFLIYTYRLIQIAGNLKVRLKNVFSDYLRTNINWIGYWVVSFVIVSLIIIVTVLLADIGYMNISTSFVIVNFSMSFQLFFIGQFGIKSDFTFKKEITHGDDLKEKYSKSGITDDQLQTLSRMVIEFMEEKKPYLNNELTLSDIAEELNIPTYQTSQVINEGIGKSFFDLVNEYRIEEVKKKLSDQNFSHLSFLGIGFESGFNSKSGFYKAFKKSTGMTPSEYKRSI